MNSTLPPARDLPPHRQAEIRAELERAVTRRRSLRFAPLVASAAAVVAVVAAVAFLAPWQKGGTAVSPAASTGQTTTTVPTSPPPDTRHNPVIPGLTPERIAAIEQGCPQSAGVGGASRLYNLIQDQAGAFALVYSDNGTAMGCTLDGPSMPFNSDMSTGWRLDWLPGALSIDSNGGSAGGDVPGNKAIYAGMHGTEHVAGRVSDKVAKIVYTQGDQTVEGVITNGTYIARIVRPTTWEIPEGYTLGVVRAYDANGALLGSNADIYGNCYVDPRGTIVHGQWNNPDPAKCLPATRWR